ncbi:hypothetical protein MNEG_11564 [Monoraphidium neglectum]|uniref:Uncharacterized protein n=1 Tax=Monoraphidium neglectum TaxID=145388 RepID=A0A0D2M546_9CHLO|nr:hypothetical protein MNEG_11564 [Monoraphidium neglectum]KIY96396.1 hypothetical protein MNEG_11564 [Monoraphidium neglectum]|eukprot:XP_013895416.1 hypothetical protein MNEG_11564 [Monoraphidium neglectum]
MATGGANNGGVTFDTKQMLGIYGGTLALCGLLNSGPVKIIALINDSSVWWHVLGTALIVIALPCIAAVKQPASFAFTSFADNSEETGVYNPGYIFFLGLLMSQWTITGFDASAHMSEETTGAALAAPYGILSAVGASAVIGWAYIFALVFCIQDPSNLFNPDSATGGALPVFQIFWDVFQSKWGSGKASLVLAVFPLIAALYATPFA